MPMRADRVRMNQVSEKEHLTGLSLDELGEFMNAIGEPAYRARQVFKGLHGRRLRSFDEMTDLPKSLREKLSETAAASTLTVESKYTSVDGTRRFLMRTVDGRPVET